MSTREEKPSVNPEYNRPVREDDEELSAWLFRHHKAAGSLETYYDLYPQKRPPELTKERKIDPARSGGRGR